MKKNSLCAIAFFIIVLTASNAGGVMAHSAVQQSTPTAAPVPTVTPQEEVRYKDLEGRIERLEIVQKETILSFTTINEYNKFLFNIMGIIVTLLVGIQSYATFIQFRREREREERQAQRDKTLDQAQLDEAKKVTGIMDVVQQTLESRLLAEKAEREKTQKLEDQLNDVASRLELLNGFYRRFQSIITKSRDELENEARWLAGIGRHDFRGIPDKLHNFAQRYDRFFSDYKDMEENVSAFTARVPYIRGIAAHYSNQPKIVEDFLIQVVSREEPEADEDDLACKRRRANAYYYLGLNESNFARYDEALKHFEVANNLDAQSRDFLTKVVLAEAYVMSGEFDKAEQKLSEIETRMQEIQQLEESLRPSERRLKCRAALVRANILILKGKEHWLDEARSLLESVRNVDPSYYYVTATLAQLSHLQGNQPAAKALFQDVHETLSRLKDMNTIREVRSRILILMIAGMAARYIGLEIQSNNYLDQAIDLCGNLPVIGSQVCTVFSTLTKRNEPPDTIRRHIELIRNGEILTT